MSMATRTLSATLTSLCLAGRRRLLSVHRDGVPVTSPWPGRWLVWWDWRNTMYRLLQEQPPLGFNFPVSRRWPFQSFIFFLFFVFFFYFLPVATSSHHLAVSCQLSCSAAFSLCCTRFNLMFPPRSVGRLSPDIEDLSCAGPICDLISSCYFHPLIIPPENLFSLVHWRIVFFSLEKKTGTCSECLA